VDVEVVESVTKTIGSLALAYPYLRRLTVAETIDALTIKGKEREVSTGTVLEVLVLNRLAVRPTPISKAGAAMRVAASLPMPAHHVAVRLVACLPPHQLSFFIRW